MAVDQLCPNSGLRTAGSHWHLYEVVFQMHFVCGYGYAYGKAIGLRSPVADRCWAIAPISCVEVCMVSWLLDSPYEKASYRTVYIYLPSPNPILA